MSAIEFPHPGRGSSQLLTKIWGSGANVHGVGTPQAAASLLLINPSAEAAFLNKPTHALREAQDSSGALGHSTECPGCPLFAIKLYIK